jgi:hypothetical protein
MIFSEGEEFNLDELFYLIMQELGKAIEEFKKKTKSKPMLQNLQVIRFRDIMN